MDVMKNTSILQREFQKKTTCQRQARQCRSGAMPRAVGRPYLISTFCQMDRSPSMG